MAKQGLAAAQMKQLANFLLWAVNTSQSNHSFSLWLEPLDSIVIISDTVELTSLRLFLSIGVVVFGGDMTLVDGMVEDGGPGDRIITTTERIWSGSRLFMYLSCRGPCLVPGHPLLGLLLGYSCQTTTAFDSSFPVTLLTIAR